MAVPYACLMGLRSDEGVLITGVYGAGKSTVAAEISYLLEQRRPAVRSAGILTSWAGA